MMELIERIGGSVPVDDTVTLTFERRQKSRQRLHLDSGREAALMLPPGTRLDDGDGLRATDGTCVRVCAAAEEVAEARSDDPLRLARACYHVGNRHVPLQIGSGWIRYQRDHVLDEMLRFLGLSVVHAVEPFQPERGAYHSHHHEHSNPTVVHGHHH